MEDMSYLALNNRPALAAEMSEISHLSALLAASPNDRSRFMAAPGNYLAGKSIHVGSAKLKDSKFAQTSEICTAVAGCNVLVAVNAAANVNVLATVNAAAGVNVAAGINAYSVAIAYSSAALWTETVVF
ncbi:MAG: hypothetical protein ABSB60_00345 [Terracidiphilus sp.]|jgi:hypothetical protein